MPVAGAFGRIVAIGDATFFARSRGDQLDSEAVLMDLDALIAEGRVDWKERIDFEVGRADFIVFHWPVEPTQAMTWEFDRATAALPVDRMLWITTRAAHEPVAAWIAAKLPRSNPRLCVVDDPTAPTLRRLMLDLVHNARREPRSSLVP